MCDIIEVTDLDAPELDVYARLTQAQLRSRRGAGERHCSSRRALR